MTASSYILAETAVALPAPRRIGRWIAGGTAALALALTTAMPAQAGGKGDDLAKALIAAIVIGAIVSEVGKDRPAPVPVPEPVHKKKKKKKWDDHEGVRIPSVCAIQVSQKRHTSIVYPESCLRDYGVRGRLPYDCASEARIYGEWDTIFSAQCLRESGFVIGSRHEAHNED